MGTTQDRPVAARAEPPPWPAVSDPGFSLAFDLPVRPARLCASLYRPRRGDQHIDRVQECWELMVVQAGRLPIWEEDRRFDVGPGEALLLHPGRRHRGAAPYDTDLACVCLHWHYDAPSSGSLGLALPQLSRPQPPERIYELCHRALAMQAERAIDSLIGRLLLLQILAEVAASGRAATPEDALVGRIRTIIDAEFFLALTPGSLAQRLGYEADYLNERFRSVAGTTLTDAIGERRMAEACGLLRDTALTAAEVSVRCGFTDAAYFSRAFKRRIGCTPVAYRRLYGRRAVNS